MTRALRGHANLRTRTVPVDIPADERERCPQCGAVLRRSNHGLCAPCAGVLLPDIPDIYFALLGKGTSQDSQVARLISGERGASRWSDLDERDAEIIQRVQDGETARQVAFAFGLSTTQVHSIARGGEGRNHGSRKARAASLTEAAL